MKKYKLSDLFDLQMGKTPARNNPKYWEEGTNPWISIADMSSNGKYITTTKECITDRAISDTGIRPIFPGTVIMSFKLSIGKVARTTVKSYSNEAIMAFEIKDREPSQYTIDNDYAYYLLSALNFENIGNKAVMGKTLNKAILENTEVYVHPWDEQRRIISKLDKVIELIKLRTQQLSKLDELVKSRFVELFDDNVPTAKLGDVCRMINGDRGKNYPSGDDFVENGVPFVNAGHLQNRKVDFCDMNYITEEKFNLLSQGKMQEGDILYCLRGSLGKHGLVDFERGAVASSLVILRCNQEQVLPQFLLYALETPEIEVQLKAANNGSSQPNLSAASVKAYDIKLPTIEQQKQFVSFVEQTDKSKLAIQKSLEKLETLKKALMQKYFG